MSKAGSLQEGNSKGEQEAKREANEPVMVAGGFLTCFVTDDERWQTQRDDSNVIAMVDCFLSDEKNRPISLEEPDLVEFRTFDQEGFLKQVAVAATVELNGTHWILSMTTIASPWLVIAELSGLTFETEINTDSLKLPNETIIPIESGPINSAPAFILGPELIINGSFDEPAVVNPQFSDNSKSWRHYDPADVTGWEAEWNNNSCNSNVRIEIQRLNQSNRQFTDLSGSCEFGATPPAGGSNLRIFQIIPTTIGSVYQLNFSYMVQNARSAAFRVEGPQGVLFDTANLEKLEENVWREVTVQFTAENEESRLIFSESGPDPLTGTLLDNVSVKEMRRRLID